MWACAQGEQPVEIRKTRILLNLLLLVLPTKRNIYGSGLAKRRFEENLASVSFHPDRFIPPLGGTFRFRATKVVEEFRFIWIVSFFIQPLITMTTTVAPRSRKCLLVAAVLIGVITSVPPQAEASLTEFYPLWLSGENASGTTERNLVEKVREVGG